MKRRHGITCGGLLVATVVFGGCTGHAGDNSATGGPSARPTPATSAAPDGFGTRHVTLACADAVTASATDAQRLTGDDVGFEGLTTPAGPAPPRAADVGLRLPPGLRWYFRKAPLVMRAGSGDVTVDVSGPGQALAWVPSTVWTSGGSPDLGPWAASSVTLHSCPDKTVLFLGGLLAADPATCLLLRVRSTERAEETDRQRLNGSPCTG
jgi:hypothetical protein